MIVMLLWKEFQLCIKFLSSHILFSLFLYHILNNSDEGFMILKSKCFSSVERSTWPERQPRHVAWRYVFQVCSWRRGRYLRDWKTTADVTAAIYQQVSTNYRELPILQIYIRVHNEKWLQLDSQHALTRSSCLDEFHRMNTVWESNQTAVWRLLWSSPALSLMASCALNELAQTNLSSVRRKRGPSVSGFVCFVVGVYSVCVYFWESLQLEGAGCCLCACFNKPACVCLCVHLKLCFLTCFCVCVCLLSTPVRWPSEW